jgi:chemotaxis signal transduction protein
MSEAQRRLLCVLGGRRHLLPVAAIERVWPAMAMQPLPGAPAQVSGVVLLHGERVPVIRMQPHTHDVKPGDFFVLVRTGAQRLGFFVDAVEGVVDAAPDAVDLLDIDRLFTPEDARRLAGALSVHAAEHPA